MADDITVEADSGGHTDNRPLVSAFPAILNLRDEIQALHPERTPVRIGAAGGIATPASALAAFMMGAAYIITGSVNQACVESGASDHTRSLLAQAEMTDVTMAPASDMFEMGVQVQVLKRGTMFAMRAQKLYEIYKRMNRSRVSPSKSAKSWKDRSSRRPSRMSGRSVNYSLINAIPARSNARTRIQKIRWRSCSAGIWDCHPAGPIRAKPVARWIIRSGADPRWALSTTG